MNSNALLCSNWVRNNIVWNVYPVILPLCSYSTCFTWLMNIISGVSFFVYIAEMVDVCRTLKYDEEDIFYARLAKSMVLTLEEVRHFIDSLWSRLMNGDWWFGMRNGVNKGEDEQISKDQTIARHWLWWIGRDNEGLLAKNQLEEFLEEISFIFHHLRYSCHLRKLRKLSNLHEEAQIFDAFEQTPFFFCNTRETSAKFMS